MCWYAVKKLRTHSPPVTLTQSWTCRFFCCQKWTGLEVESQKKLWLKTHSPIPPLIFTVVKSTKFGLNFRPSRPWGALVLKRTTYRKPETNLRVSMTRLCPLRLGDVPSCTQLWQVKISRTILLREKMPEKIAELSMTRPQIIRFCWNSASLCSVGPRKRQNPSNPLPIRSKRADSAQAGRSWIVINPPRIVQFC